MRFDEGCPCCGAIVSRRNMLRAGLATAAASVTPKGFAQALTGTAGDHDQVNAVDIHAHYFPRAFLELIASDGARFGYGAEFTDSNFTLKSPSRTVVLPNKFVDLELRLADMDRQGISVQALSLTAPMVYWADEELSHRLAVAWNDAAIAAHRAKPDRFVALATLPMLSEQRALGELDRVGRLAGVRGIYLGTNIDNHDLDDPRFVAILARIDELGLPIFLHPLQTVGGERMQEYYLSNLLGNPIDTAIAACHLIFGGVLDRHPNLKVTLPHAGGVLPILIGRIDRGWKVRAEAKNLPRAPSSYLRQFHYDTIAHSKPILQFLISQVGADRIMIGSDYCFDMGYERPVEIVDELDLTTDARAMILGGTAAKLLKI
jgi:aminocarboxymuconate-semialdehyde decarboxylase